MGGPVSSLKPRILVTLVVLALLHAQPADTGTFKVEGRRVAEPDDLAGVSLVHFFKPAGGNLPTPAEIARKPADDLNSPGVQGTSDFPVDPRIGERVKFWIRVYSELTSSQGVIHDSKNVNIIYKKIDFEDLNDFTINAKARKKMIEERIKSEKKHIETVLLSIHKKQNNLDSLSEEERAIYEKFIGIDEIDKFKVAASHKRLRFQLGQKDRFYQGLYYSGRYLPVMEKTFKSKGLPVELTRLPFVESSFNLRARSKVGASGVWQFMRSTGKIFLKIDELIDERNDPIRATEAAAELLKGNHETLGSWPLALTAYNHGRLGMVRAVKQVGSTNLADIIDNYRSPSFGFASSNFYAEFIAAVEVSTHAEKYFGKIETEKPIEFAEFVMTDFVDFHDISTYCRIPKDVLQEMNPGLTDAVTQSDLLIPAGYVLRIPPENRDLFLSRYREIPSHRKFASQKSPDKRYIARHPSSNSAVNKTQSRRAMGAKRRR
jgi:membrane-bound lytic murein transglycosylase D